MFEMADWICEETYAAELLEELPGGIAPRIYYPGGIEGAGADGLIVRIHPTKGMEWIGIFAFGLLSRHGVSGLYACPRTSWLCVVSRGAGYLVNTSDPREAEQVGLEPILGVLPVPSQNRLVFHDFTRLAALGETGLAWETPSLSWDGLKEVRVQGKQISGVGWDAGRGQWVPFEVALDTGNFEGGSSSDVRGTDQ